MEQFVFVPAYVYNKSLNTHSVKKQDFPKYQPSQNHTYLDDSLNKEINKKLSGKADSLVDKIFVKSPYQALKVADFRIGCCGNWSYTVRLCSTNSS